MFDFINITEVVVISPDRKCGSLPSSPNERLHFTQQKHSGCQFLSSAVTIFWKKNQGVAWRLQWHETHVPKRWPHFSRLSRWGWACCSERSAERRGWSSRSRSTVVRPSRKSCGCPTQSRTVCTQSALGATPSPEPWPPAQTAPFL